MAPVVLFVFKRTDTLSVTLDCLRRNRVRQLIVYADAARSEDDSSAVEAVRQMVRAIDWCDVELHFREKNVGLGVNIRDGVSEALTRYDSVIVCEDDLEFVEGTLDYMSAALERYASDPRVMSVTGWTNAKLTPGDVGVRPYFDGRAECWLWGTWRRVWDKMSEMTAEELMNRIIARGERPYKWGGDLPIMARMELTRNIWAVRFVYLHVFYGGLCLRPPWSMVNHIGWGNGATNVCERNWEYNGKLRSAPPIPQEWPEPILNPRCEALDLKMYPRPWCEIFPRLVPVVRKVLSKIGIRL